MGSQWDVFNKIVTQHSHDKEEVVQKLFEQMFAELFGYSRLFGDIETHRVLHIGSTDRVIPDIIIRDSVANKDLFIVELKQLNLSWNTKFEDQILSYMRLLSLNVGVLICDAIYLYYLENDKVISSKISISQDNIKGNAFMELFRKNAFNIEAVKDFISQSNITKENVDKIISELTPQNIKTIIQLYLLEAFSQEEIDIALQNIDFKIVDNRIVSPPPPPPPMGKKIYNYNGETTICRIVLNIVKDYANKNNTSFAILSGVFPNTLQGSLGVVRDEAYIRQSNSDRRRRFFTKPNDVLHLTDGVAYVCTQWAGPSNFQEFLKTARRLGYTITENDQ